MIPIATALVEFGADGLCVATFDEAVALRDAGIACRLSVLYPVPPDRAAEARRLRIAVAAGDRTTLGSLLNAADAGSPATPALDIELEVETGLGRGGIGPDDVAAAASLISAAGGARLVGLWTHLQASETADRTARQIERFEAATAGLTAAGFTIPRRHVAASGGLLLPGIPPYDAVRPGLMIYGLVPDEIAGTDLPPAAEELRPVMSLRARAVRVADLPARFRSATVTAGRGRSRIGRTPSSAVGGSRSSAMWRWTRSWSTSPTSPDRRSTVTTSSSCSAGRRASRSPPPTWRGAAPRTRGKS